MFYPSVRYAAHVFVTVRIITKRCGTYRFIVQAEKRVVKMKIPAFTHQVKNAVSRSFAEYSENMVYQQNQGGHLTLGVYPMS